jgi:O-antigen/teichoic acid export membrane protein
VGWYGAALQLHATLNFFPLILSTAMLPLMSRLFAERSTRFLPMASKATAYTLMLSLPIGVGLAVSAGAVIDLLGYPEAFDNSVPVLVILALSVIPAGQLMVLYMIVTAMNRQGEWVRLIAASIVVGLVLNLLLIPLAHHFTGNGGIGAAVASLSAETAQLAMAVRLMPEGLYQRENVIHSMKAAGAVIVMGAAVVGLQSFADAPFYVFVPAGAALYAAALLASRAVRISDLHSLADDWRSSRGNTGRAEPMTAVAVSD